MRLQCLSPAKKYFANKTKYAPYLHELGHKFYYDTIKSIAREKQIGYTKAQGITDACIYEYLHEKLLEGKSIGSLLSEYANSGYKAQLHSIQCLSPAKNGNRKSRQGYGTFLRG